MRDQLEHDRDFLLYTEQSERPTLVRDNWGLRAGPLKAMVQLHKVELAP